MRLLIAAAVVSAVSIAQMPAAHAIGCISGGLAGAAAGHLAHHGILGALGGCIAGHELNKHQQMQQNRQQMDSDRSQYNDNNKQ